MNCDKIAEIYFEASPFLTVIEGLSKRISGSSLTREAYQGEDSCIRDDSKTPNRGKERNYNNLFKGPRNSQVQGLIEGKDKKIVLDNERIKIDIEKYTPLLDDISIQEFFPQYCDRKQKFFYFYFPLYILLVRFMEDMFTSSHTKRCASKVGNCFPLRNDLSRENDNVNAKASDNIIADTNEKSDFDDCGCIADWESDSNNNSSINDWKNSSNNNNSITDILKNSSQNDKCCMNSNISQIIRRKHCFVIGISAPQGFGKTTLATILQKFFVFDGARCVSLSLDDFYLTAKEQELLRNEHTTNPFLEFRGNPGTHDIQLAIKTLKALKNRQKVSIPRYDKYVNGGKGDRIRMLDTDGDVDTVLFEGWMLGFSAVDMNNAGLCLSVLNQMEVVNKYLKKYRPLHDLIDIWVIVKVQNPSIVYKWRLEQERRSTNSGLSDKEVTDFVSRFMPSYELYLPALYSQGPDGWDRSKRLVYLEATESRYISSVTCKNSS